MTLTPQKPMSTAQAGAIAKAQAASKAALAGKSPRTVGVDRAEQALLWVYRWGWTTPTVLELAMNSSGRSGLGKRLVKSGLLVRTPTPSGGINQTPSCLLTLSRAGLEHATALATKLLPYELNPLRIKASTIHHSETIQRLTAAKLWFWSDDSAATSYLTEKELSLDKKPGTKVPDVMWNLEFETPQKPRQNVAVEIELSAKWGHELDTFVYLSLRQISNNAPQAYDAIEIYSTSPAILQRYEAAFEPGRMLPTWVKEPGKTGRWTHGSPVKIPERDTDQVRFFKITPEMLRPTRETTDL
jgi:hypothetical protein